MQTIPGVSIYLSAEDKSLRVGNEGHLLDTPQPDTTLVLKARILPRNGRIRVPFTLAREETSGHSNLVAKKRDGDGYYNHKILVRSTETGLPYTKYPENHMRLLEVSTQGIVAMWEFAVVSDWGKFFLTTQATYTTTCYRDARGDIACPLLENSPPIMAAIRKCLSERTGSLPPIEDYNPPRDIRDTTLLALPEKSGLVIWWNEAMRTGMIRTAEGEEVRVLGINIRTKRTYRTFLVPGEVVLFKELRPTNSKTKFKLDALGVTM